MEVPAVSPVIPGHPAGPVAYVSMERAVRVLTALREELEAARHGLSSDWWLTSDEERIERRRELARLAELIDAVDLAVGALREEEDAHAH